MKGRGIGNFLIAATAVPDKPWLADKDWRTGVIRDSNRRTGPVLAIIAILVNLLTVPMVLPLWHKVVDEGVAIDIPIPFMLPQSDDSNSDSIVA